MTAVTAAAPVAAPVVVRPAPIRIPSAAAPRSPVVSGREPAAGRRNLAPPIVGQALARPGQPIDPPARRFLEARFRHDFGRLRVHADDLAARSAAAVDAPAYTVGNDLVFGAGTYRPRTLGGIALIAHEAAHAASQGSPGTGSSSGRPPAGEIPIAPRGLAAERRADRVARSLLRRNPDRFAGPAPGTAGPWLQRAEHGTYVSTVGDPLYLDAGAQFYRTWGHPNVKRVSTMLDVLTDLDKATSTIDTFRIVSHGASIGLELGFLKEISADWFGKDATEFTDEARFRKEFISHRITSESFFDRIYGALQKDPATAALLTTLGAGAKAPADDSPLGILLRAIVDARLLATATLNTGGPAKFANAGPLNAFTTSRITTYSAAVVGAAPKADQPGVTKAIADLRAGLPGAMTTAGLTFGTFTAAEASSFGDDLIDSAKTTPTLRSDLSKSITEGATGPYLRRLRSVRGKIGTATHVEIRGCNVGSSPSMLDAIRSFFGATGAIPSISAPDLYQFFFQLAVDTYGNAPSETTRMDTAFADATSGIAASFEDARRLKAGEMTRVVNETKLTELATKYGWTAATLRKLNPEIADPNALTPGAVVWLVRRPKIQAGVYGKLSEVCNDYLGNLGALAAVKAANPAIADPDKLSPGDVITFPAAVLTGQVATAAPTAADFQTAVRGGAAVPAVNTTQNKPIVHLDDRKRATAIGAWLAAQRFDPTGRTAAQLSALFAGKDTAFMAQRARTYVQFLTRGYPNIVDAIFPDDPRYNAHIIRRP